MSHDVNAKILEWRENDSGGSGSWLRAASANKESTLRNGAERRTINNIGKLEAASRTNRKQISI